MSGSEERMLNQIYFNRQVLLFPEDAARVNEILLPLVVKVEIKVLSKIQFIVSSLGGLLEGEESRESALREALGFKYWPFRWYKDDMIVVSYDPYHQKSLGQAMEENFKLYDCSDRYTLHDPEDGRITQVCQCKKEWLKYEVRLRFHEERYKEVPPNTTPEKFIYGFGI
jgi:hypothetical protein